MVSNTSIREKLSKNLAVLPGFIPEALEYKDLALANTLRRSHVGIRCVMGHEYIDKSYLENMCRL